MTVYTQEQLQKIANKIKNVPSGMFTTINDAGVPSSRPLATQEIDGEGNMWFFSQDDAPFVHDMEKHPLVNISFSDPEHEVYLAITGEAVLVKDPGKVRSLWKPGVRAWFPRGVNDPHLALIRLRIQTADYWDASSKGMKQLLRMARGALGGRGPNGMGEHTTICL